MVKVLHLSDTHITEANGRAKILEIISKWSNDNHIDLVAHTGDFIGDVKPEGKDNLQSLLMKNINEADQAIKQSGIAEILKNNEIKTQEDLDSILSTEQKQLFNQINAHTYAPIVQAYTTINKEMKKFKAPIVGVLGNWDLTMAYELLDSIQFAELTPSIDVAGLTVQGMNNTGEIPRFYNEPSIKQALGPYFINYSTGYDDPKTKSENDLELKRLKSSGKKPDLMLYHKSPNTQEDSLGGGGSAAKKYLSGDTDVIRLAGHFHEEALRTENGYKMLRPSPNEFLVYEYEKGSNKPLYVDVYEIIRKQSPNNVVNLNEHKQQKEDQEEYELAA